MADVLIQADHSSEAEPRYIARYAKHLGIGRTRGEALDALLEQCGEPSESLPVMIKHIRADAFFSQEQYNRLQELRNRIASLTTEERDELEALLNAEFEASALRLDALSAVKPT